MAIQIQHLNKYIGKQHVLKDISLSINDGEVIGLLGPNGAGKSTLMKIMVGVWDATSGEVQVPKSVGFLPEQNPLYEDMYVREYLRFFVGLRSKEQGAKNKDQLVEELIERVGLTAEANKRVGQLSKGYKQRVGLAQAMIGDPELLILDEPTTGLDPNQLEDIRALIREMGAYQSKYKTGSAKVKRINQNLRQLDVGTYTDAVGYSYRIDGNNVDPDNENVELAANTEKYNGLIDSMSSEFERLKSVMK